MDTTRNMDANKKPATENVGDTRSQESKDNARKEFEAKKASDAPKSS
jgi:hypothetical protein